MAVSAGIGWADFRYIPAEAERPTLSLVEEGEALTLEGVLASLAPSSLTLRFDRRVETGRPLAPPYGDWETLLKREGLAWMRNGTEVHVFPEGMAADAIELIGADPAGMSWRIGAEETLREVLERWSERAGVDVLWLTDRRYRLHEARVLSGSFEEAVGALFFLLSHLPHAPVAELAGDGGVLSVMHRPSRGGSAG